MADLIVFMVRYCSPFLNKLAKNSKNGWIAHEMGSICHSEHQPSHLLQALSYVEFVPLLYPAASSCEVSLEIPSVCCLCLITSKRLNVVDLLLSEAVACQMGPSRVLEFVEASEESPLAALATLDTMVVTSKTGAISIREALSSLTFLTLRQKGGKAYP